MSTLSVRGGADGITAFFDDLLAVAHLFDLAAHDLDETLSLLWWSQFSAELTQTRWYDPVGAEAYRAAAQSVSGWLGAGLVSEAFHSSARRLRCAVELYQAADHPDHGMLAGLVGLFTAVPKAFDVGLATWLQTGEFSLSFQYALTSDPGLFDDFLDGTGLLGYDRMLGWELNDGHPVLHDLGRDSRPAAATPPRDVADLMAGLELRNQGEPGEIDVKFVTDRDGVRHVIVDIPGTKTFDPSKTADITGLSTNVRAVVGEPTSYAKGVLAAMARAGVRPSDDVLVVGHSEGGMVAVEVAKDAATSGRFSVTHVVTAGAPIGRTVGALPSTVQVLALENSDDIVPHLDGRTNPDRPNITTVTDTDGDSTIGGDHGLSTSYEPEAADVDASDNASIRAFLSSASGFFGGADVRTQAYVITRGF